MLAQHADSNIRHPEGVVENMLVRVLTDFIVLAMEENLGIELILEQPFPRDVRAGINVGTNEIRFRIGVDNIFLKFLYRKEQCFVIQQAHNGGLLWGSLEPQPEKPSTTQSKKKRIKKVWLKVESASLSTSPGRDDKW